jgi:2-dehydro-3-deoxyphosphogluconate aldolase/(4S)-4-hydroxy-2-oxoglutarate aldolase
MEDSIEMMERGLEQARLVAIVRLVDHTNVVEIATILCDAGLQFLEITVERPEGFRSIERVVAAVGGRATIGAGTVLSTADVARAADAGARFIVAPNTNPAVINAAHERALLALPGALTPTEVAVATSTGARFIKLFPGSVGGVAYLNALRGPFPNVKFVPTGGVTNENASSWLAAGAAAIAMGSNLVHGSGDIDGLIERARQAVASTALHNS